MPKTVVLSESLITAEKCYQAGELWECGSEEEAAELIAANLAVPFEQPPDDDQANKKTKGKNSKGA